MADNFKAATLIGPDGTRVPVRNKQEADRLFASGYKLDSAPQPIGGQAAQSGGSNYQAAGASPLNTYKSKENFLQIVKEAIRKKQKYNKDIQAQEEIFRTKQRDTSPFKDKDFQLMSPSSQAAVRASRSAASSAHLQGLREEKEYRGQRMEDILKETGNIFEEQRTQEDRKLINEQRRLNLLKTREELGITPTPAEVYGTRVEHGKRVDDRIGGSPSWRHNNPGNIKFGEFAQQYGADKGQDATDGGAFAIFPDLESGKKAMKDLLQGENYIDLSVDAAMKRWSNNGYGADVWAGSSLSQSSLMGDLSEEQLDDLTKHMVKKEGWDVGTTGEKRSKHNTWTKAAAKTLASKFQNLSSNDLWDNYTDNELDALLYEANNNIIEATIKKLPPQALLRIGVSRDLARDILTLKFERGMSADEIKANMSSIGLDPSTYDDFAEILDKIDYTNEFD